MDLQNFDNQVHNKTHGKLPVVIKIRKSRRLGIDDLQPVCAVLLPPDDCFVLALRKSRESELSNKRGRIPVKTKYEGGCKDALSTRSIGTGKSWPQTAQFLPNNGPKCSYSRCSTRLSPLTVLPRFTASSWTTSFSSSPVSSGSSRARSPRRRRGDAMTRLRGKDVLCFREGEAGEVEAILRSWQAITRRTGPN